MPWRESPPFEVAHQYPAGKAPKDEHPKGWGRLERRTFGAFGDVALVIYSTRRRADGWSYNVAELRDRPAWVGYYHHKPSGKRLRAANSPNALPLAQLLNAV